MISPVQRRLLGRRTRQAHLLVANDDLYGNPIVTASPWAAFLAAMLATLVIASLIGYPALRLKGHYLAMATLGFGLIVYKNRPRHRPLRRGGRHQRRAGMEAGLWPDGVGPERPAR